MSEALPVLRAVRDLLSNPKSWAQTALAYDDGGGECAPDDPKARCWCLVGAVEKVARIPSPSGFQHPAVEALLDTIEQRLLAADAYSYMPLDDDAVPEFNDDDATDHPAVLKLLDDTIQRLSE